MARWDKTYDEEGNPVAVMGKRFRIFASTLAGDRLRSRS